MKKMKNKYATPGTPIASQINLGAKKKRYYHAKMQIILAILKILCYGVNYNVYLLPGLPAQSAGRWPQGTFVMGRRSPLFMKLRGGLWGINPTKQG